jgi:hypothetical protein
MIRSFQGLWLRPVVLGAIGIAFALAAFFYLRARLADPEPLPDDALAAHS